MHVNLSAKCLARCCSIMGTCPHVCASHKGIWGHDQQPLQYSNKKQISLPYRCFIAHSRGSEWLGCSSPTPLRSPRSQSENLCCVHSTLSHKGYRLPGAVTWTRRKNGALREQTELPKKGHASGLSEQGRREGESRGC